MKKILVVVVVVAMALVGANIALATISGSKHDMTSATYYSGATQSSCAYCHTPHHSTSTAAPLWNRNNPAASSYTVYGGGTTNSGTAVGAPGVNSLTCLSCHDGTIGVGEVANGTNDTITDAGTVLDATGHITSAATLIGTDLRTSHPVGVVYNSAVTLAGLNATVDATSGKVGGKNWKIYGGGNGTGTVQCGSCHDPHQTTAGYTPFLKDTLSTICSDCHSTK